MTVRSLTARPVSGRGVSFRTTTSTLCGRAAGARRRASSRERLRGSADAAGSRYTATSTSLVAVAFPRATEPNTYANRTGVSPNASSAASRSLSIVCRLIPRHPTTSGVGIDPSHGAHTPDALIAGSARAHGAALLTDDLEDVPMAGVRARSPTLVRNRLESGKSGRRLRNLAPVGPFSF